MNPKLEIEITAYAKEILPAKNGLIKGDILTMYKENLLVDSLLKYHYLVGDKKSYPQDDKIEIEFDLDIVILSRSRFNELKEIEQNYLRLCN